MLWLRFQVKILFLKEHVILWVKMSKITPKGGNGLLLNFMIIESKFLIKFLTNIISLDSTNQINQLTSK